MAALVAVETVVIALLVVLVAGLLRSHADILRALDELGAGLGDPDAGADARTVVEPSWSAGRATSAPHRDAEARASDIAGTTPHGDAVSFSMGGDTDTLVAFLTSGCETCRSIWDALGRGAPELPSGIRVVVVTGDPDDESAARVAELAATVDVSVVMSSEAWRDYEVPRSPYFVLVEAATARISGEGSAGRWEQVIELLARARANEHSARSDAARARDRAARRSVEAAAHDRRREARNDAELLRAGVEPGDPRLHFDATDRDRPHA